jgi:hypothetical protein
MKREPARIPVDDPTTEKAIDEVRRATVELCRDPFLSGRDIDVTLQPNVPLLVQTGLGRKFVNYTLSAPRGGAGAVAVIVETARTDTSITLESLTAGSAVVVTLRVW